MGETYVRKYLRQTNQPDEVLHRIGNVFSGVGRGQYLGGVFAESEFWA